MRTLILGGAGFVGRHITRRCLDEGDEVLVVDPIVAGTGGIDTGDGWPLFEPRDYKNFSFAGRDCRSWFGQYRTAHFDRVFHLAAVVGGRQMIENQPLAVAVDLEIDAAYWRWAKEARPEKTICFSSSAVYPVKLQARENHVSLEESMVSFDQDLGLPDLSYGWAKLTCEYLAKLAYEKHGLKSVCFRPFSGYGEDQDLAYPFPSICKRVLERRPVLEIWGSGRQIRDFIHIDDCVSGIFGMMGQIDDASAVNLSTGIGTSFFSFAEMACEVIISRPTIVAKEGTPEGVYSRVGDTEKQFQMGFRPRISLRDGIERAMAYYVVEGAASRAW